MGFLRFLQSRPQGVKAQYAFAIAGVVTGLIGIIWASTVPTRLAEMMPKDNSFYDEEGALGDFIGETKNQFGNIIDWNKEILSNEGLVPTEAPSEGENQDVGAIPTPNIVMPENLSPETIGERPTIPYKDTSSKSQKKILIETVNGTPEVIMIDTREDPKTE